MPAESAQPDPAQPDPAQPDPAQLDPAQLDQARTGSQRLGRPGSPVYGTWIKLASLETVEAIARAGFDFVVIDLEHSPRTLESAYASMVVAQALGLAALVRVSDRSGTQVQRLLDVVAQMQFPPHGARGLGSTSRAGQWGGVSQQAYLERADGLVRCVQLESEEAIGNAGAILDTPGVNAVLLGLGDLTLSTGLTAADPTIVGWADTVLRQAGQRNVPCGTAVGTTEAARQAAERGYSFILVNNDIGLFADAARATMSAVRATPGGG